METCEHVSASLALPVMMMDAVLFTQVLQTSSCQNLGLFYISGAVLRMYGDIQKNGCLFLSKEYRT